MKRNPWLPVAVIIALFFGGGLLFTGMSCLALFKPHEPKITKPSILALTLDGVILDGRKFVEQLVKYRDEEDIKAVLIRINSPGGVVGPSQEIWREIQRTREELHKPVVIVSSSLLASGAYYAAVAGSKIVVAPGTLVGSIGVIMEFANLKGLYSWAKIERYAITTGKFKDTGAEYKAMSPEERALLQELLDDVFGQFKKAVSEGRKLSMNTVSKYADGRVFTGQKAVELGFADQVGSYEDAVTLAGELAGIKGEPELVEPPKVRPSFWDFVRMGGEDEDESVTKIQKALQGVLHTRLSGIPLFLMPGTN